VTAFLLEAMVTRAAWRLALALKQVVVGWGGGVGE